MKMYQYLLALLFAISMCVSVYAQDWNDITDYYEQGNYGIRAPQGAYPPVAQQQYQPVQQQQPQKKRGLFSFFRKRAKSPILQAEKFPKGPPKETQPLPNPLIRLTQAIRHQGGIVRPGFYLLGVSPPSQQGAAFLFLMRENEHVLTVPALTSAASEPVPDNRTSAEKKKQKNLPPPTLGRIESSVDGQTVTFIYQQGETQYSSIPLRIAPSWQPY